MFLKTLMSMAIALFLGVEYSEGEGWLNPLPHCLDIAFHKEGTPMRIAFDPVMGL